MVLPGGQTLIFCSFSYWALPIRQESESIHLAANMAWNGCFRYIFAIILFVQSFDYSWLVDEIKLNLPKELDFLNEAENAERCRRNLQSRQSRVRGRWLHSCPLGVDELWTSPGSFLIHYSDIWVYAGAQAVENFFFLSRVFALFLLNRF